MSEYKAQENDLIYALDIGTRSVIGMVGQTDGDRFKVLDVEAAEHKKRAMIDGQIDNIRQVAEVVRQVTRGWRRRLMFLWERVCWLRRRDARCKRKRAPFHFPCRRIT